MKSLSMNKKGVQELTDRIWLSVIRKFEGSEPLLKGNGVFEKLGRMWSSNNSTQGGRQLTRIKLQKNGHVKIQQVTAWDDIDKGISLETVVRNGLGEVVGASSGSINPQYTAKLEEILGRQLKLAGNFMSTDSGSSLAQVADNTRRTLYKYNPHIAPLSYRPMTQNTRANIFGKLSI